MHVNKFLLKRMLVVYNIILIIAILFILMRKGIMPSGTVFQFIVKAALFAGIAVLIFMIPTVERFLQKDNSKRKKPVNLQLFRIENPFLVGFFFGLGFFLALVVVYFILIMFALV